VIDAPSGIGRTGGTGRTSRGAPGGGVLGLGLEPLGRPPRGVRLVDLATPAEDARALVSEILETNLERSAALGAERGRRRPLAAGGAEHVAAGVWHRRALCPDLLWQRHRAQVSSPVVRRVNVVGTSGSGKSTVGAELARRMGVPFVEIDALAWLPGWEPRDPDALREAVGQAVAGDAWVVDGNYGVARDLVWARADTVVWLDLSLPLVLWRVTARTARRAARREVLWGTNRESLRTALSRGSIIWYALTNFRSRRLEYANLLAAHPELSAVRLRSPGDVRRFLESVRPVLSPEPSSTAEVDAG
jgi:adenylate kinase family enzyme